MLVKIGVQLHRAVWFPSLFGIKDSRQFLILDIDQINSLLRNDLILCSYKGDRIPHIKGFSPSQNHVIEGS